MALFNLVLAPIFKITIICFLLISKNKLDLLWMKYVKIAIPTFLLLIMFIISGRYFVFLSYIDFQKTTIKKEAISNRHSQTITKFVSERDLYKNKNGLEWKDHNSEIVINGTYYEVIQINRIQAGYILHLKSDEKESDFYRTYFKLKNEDEGGRNASVIQLLINVLFLPNQSDHSFCMITGQVNYPEHIIPFKVSDHLHRLIKPPSFS